MKCCGLFLSFSQLYGEADPDQDVSPDTEDPEAAGNSLLSQVALNHFLEKENEWKVNKGVDKNVVPKCNFFVMPVFLALIMKLVL